MSTFTHLTTELHGSTQLIIINRPTALNALNKAVLAELATAFELVGKTDAIRGVIITGEGEKAFVAGADIKELSVLSNAEALELSKKGHALFSLIENSTKPVIAVVNGFALGGGCELAMACHLRIATDNAKFGLPEVNLGLIPGYGGTQRLTQLLGRPKALELAMTGDMIPAADAKTLGLVNHVVATKQEALELALKIQQKIEQKAPLAIAHLIKSVNAGFGFETHGYQTERESFAYLFTTQDFVEGTSAFMEKRKAIFLGQ
jgi:enoyl-CoA hydratase